VASTATIADLVVAVATALHDGDVDRQGDPELPGAHHLTTPMLTRYGRVDRWAELGFERHTLDERRHTVDEAIDVTRRQPGDPRRGWPHRRPHDEGHPPRRRRVTSMAPPRRVLLADRLRR
jgi:hypothetical protein